MSNDTWYKHEIKSVRDILITCVGTNFGPNPEEHLDEIRESRAGLGLKICQVLDIGGDDVVVDIGSGCGFVTRPACERAKEVHCVDINREFLDFTRTELSGFGNTRFHKIDYGEVPGIEDDSVDKVFSTAVFIHFYYYDFLFYLIEVNRILRTGGLFYVEIVDSDVLRLDKMAAIKNHIRGYRQNRGRARLIQPFSLTALLNLASQLGFSEKQSSHVADVAEVVLQKVARPELPDWMRPIFEPA